MKAPRNSLPAALARVALREWRAIFSSPIRWISMVVMPMLVVVLFTTMMAEGVPQQLPVGIVDNDRSSTSRQLIRTLDAMPGSCVTDYYPDVASARRAMQRGEIYAFVHIPRSTGSNLLSARQPSIAYYYTMAFEMAGVMLHRDLTTVASLGNASVAARLLAARGATTEQVQAALQPIVVDLHPLGNATSSYNVYLSTMLIPGVMMLFMMLITAYSLGLEVKMGTSRRLLRVAGGHFWAALLGKIAPQMAIWLVVVLTYMTCAFGLLGFPNYGGLWALVGLAVAMIMASVGFGAFVFGLLPSLRMSMSVCSLWGVLSFSMVGTAFPVGAMDAPLRALTWLFPLRHVFVVYQSAIANGFGLAGVWPHAAVLAAFALLPLTVAGRIRRAWQSFVYVE